MANDFGTDSGDSIWSFDGRFGRLEYFSFNIVATTVWLAVSWLLLLTKMLWLVALPSLPFMAFALILTARRLHDLDRSGWWMLLLFVPFVGTLLSLALLFWPGTDGTNSYGEEREGGLKHIIMAVAGFVGVGVIAAVTVPMAMRMMTSLVPMNGKGMSFDARPGVQPPPKVADDSLAGVMPPPPKPGTPEIPEPPPTDPRDWVSYSADGKTELRQKPDGDKCHLVCTQAEGKVAFDVVGPCMAEKFERRFLSADCVRTVVLIASPNRGKDWSKTVVMRVYSKATLDYSVSGSTVIDEKYMRSSPTWVQGCYGAAGQEPHYSSDGLRLEYTMMDGKPGHVDLVATDEPAAGADDEAQKPAPVKPVAKKKPVAPAKKKKR